MHVGVCHLTLHLAGNRSLKGKRRVVRSVCDRLRHRFRVSVAEVGGQDTWQMANIGIAAVSGDASVARDGIEKAISYTEEYLYDVQILEADIDVLDLT